MIDKQNSPKVAGKWKMSDFTIRINANFVCCHLLTKLGQNSIYNLKMDVCVGFDRKCVKSNKCVIGYTPSVSHTKII